MNKQKIISRSKKEIADTLKLMEIINKQFGEKFERFQIRNLNTKQINYKIVHLLHDPYIFVNAYAKISKNKGALTKGTLSQEDTMKFFGQINAHNIANKFKQNSYCFKPVRRVHIPKPNSPHKTRPIDTPTQENRIVQEAIRGILESIYEPEFSEFEKLNEMTATNFGFRPNKDCSRAVNNFKLRSQTCNYIIEGDISGAYNSVDHKILIHILNKRIKDKKFIDIIKQLLESGIMDKGNFEHSITGVPQGGIVSPLLFNIYMFEFDKFVLKLLNNYSSKGKRKISSEYQSLGYKIRKLRRNKPAHYEIEIKKLIAQRQKIPSYTPDSIPKNPIFVRYADDWILGLNVTKQEAQLVKEKIRKFLWLFLRLKLDPNKTTISHYQRDGIRFLGFEIKMWSIDQIKISKKLTKTSQGLQRINTRTTSRKITIRPDKERILRNLVLKGVCQKDGRPIGIRSWAILEEFRIVERYKSIMLGMVNYYAKCDNIYIFNQISYILLYSCAKTIATRKKITMSQVFNKYGKSLKIKVETHGKDKNESKVIRTKQIEFPTFTELKKNGTIQNLKNRPLTENTYDPFKLTYYNRTKLKVFSCCCICGNDDKVAMHHINSLQSIPLEKRKKFDYLRKRLNRLQIPVCFNCHMDITHGRYNNPISPTTFYDEWMAKL